MKLAAQCGVLHQNLTAVMQGKEAAPLVRNACNHGKLSDQTLLKEKFLGVQFNLLYFINSLNLV